MSVRDWVILDHLDCMTDSTGLIQHAIYSVPRRESGYTTDDNARALRLCAHLWCEEPDERMLARITTYLSFLEHACCRDRGFHNFLSYQRDWLDTNGTGDCQGQAIRALAEVLGSGLPDGCRALARELIEAVRPALAELRSLRAQAYIVLAWGHLWTKGVKEAETLEPLAFAAAKRLVTCYHRSSRHDWQWFETRLTYANAVLPHALFMAAKCWPHEEFLEVATESFAFLDLATTADGMYCPIGNCDWYHYGEEKAVYDQQPVEAATMAEAALTAFGLEHGDAYLSTYCRTNDWFHGNNSLAAVLADPDSGACCDGLQPLGVNQNQGAESTLAYLWMTVLNCEVQIELSRVYAALIIDAQPQVLPPQSLIV
jgi:uncharacterized protein YyaL (SSP411 family)